jgi:hypothetical protein
MRSGQRSDQEEILAAGITGERLVSAALGRALGDEWILLRGYRNNRGEIDHLVLGPGGLMAIESKHRNATVHCNGDSWWFEKFDRYGNLVERGPFRDRGGRSPSEQLSEPSQALEAFLAKRGHPVQIMRVVLLTHPRSRLGNCRNPTVGIATSTDRIIGMLNGSPRVFSPEQLPELEDLIVGDHRFHQNRRRHRE